MTWQPARDDVRSSGWSRIPHELDGEDEDVGMVQG